MVDTSQRIRFLPRIISATFGTKMLPAVAHVQECMPNWRSLDAQAPFSPLAVSASPLSILSRCLTALVCAAFLTLAVVPNGYAEGEQGNPNPAYNNVGIRDGVWNNGQASFWDLHIVDHYRIFGPEERVRGYRPEQPIKFSHVTHVQKNQMDCQYCHWSVAKAAYAAIPEVQTCMGCHLLVKGSTPEKQTEIAKVEKAWNENKPIEWTKVHVMPSHVHFNHKRHVKAGITCQSCHGQVPKMEVVERVTSMRMGWCIDCHRQKGASIDCYTCHY